MKIVSVIPALVDLFSIYAYFHHIPIHIVITLHALAEVSPPLNTMPILPLPHHICSQLDHHPVLLTLVVAISIIEPAYELKPTQQL